MYTTVHVNCTCKLCIVQISDLSNVWRTIFDGKFLVEKWWKILGGSLLVKDIWWKIFAGMRGDQLTGGVDWERTRLLTRQRKINGDNQATNNK